MCVDAARWWGYPTPYSEAGIVPPRAGVAEW
jgi:hypothetical protein